MRFIEFAPVAIFAAVAVMVFALMSLSSRTRERKAARLRGLVGEDVRPPEPGAFQRLATGALPKLAGPLVPTGAAGRDELRRRLAFAGYYRPQAMFAFLAVKLVLLMAPWVGGLVVAAFRPASTLSALVGAAIVAAAGLVAPGFWLDGRKAARQGDLREALPDFFDLLVLCLEGGMGLSAAWKRVTTEIEATYPLLARELVIVEHEMTYGRSAGDAIRLFADRTDLDEVSSLATVVGQAERFGTSMGKALRALSDSLRHARVQRAEERAHKAATKVMFPTLLFIFPGVFAIILGPVAYQLMHIFPGAKR